MSLCVGVNAPWIDARDSDTPYAASINTLVDFFVTHSPCKYQSNKPYRLEEIWGLSPWSSERVLKRPLSRILFGSGEVRLFNENSKDKTEDRLRELGFASDNFPKLADRQWAVYTRVGSNGNKSQYMSLFYHLRNAFAHARWALVDGGYLAFEDGKAIGGRATFEVSARGILSLESLVELVGYLQDVPSEQSSIEKLILGAIGAGINTKKRIKEELKITENDWRTYSGVLSREGKICYFKGKWQLLEGEGRT